MRTDRISVLLALALTACATAPHPDAPRIPMDVHSHSRPAEVRVTHLALDLRADFDAKTLSGHVDLDLERADPGAPLTLDARGLHIDGAAGADLTPRAWRVLGADPILGSRLEVDLEPGDRRVRISYRTDPAADAVQWLSPAQTDGGRKPFLFTQGQAILTRTWIPLQDTPGVRATYEATIRVADPELTAVMSADRREHPAPGLFRFAMTRPIPSYLIALAIGELESRDVSERCAIWAEPGVVERAARELEDTEAMIGTCEDLFGPYRWGRYDVLVLPPAFPFGGMENPCLTFATPTILAGDKSLVALIAHELAHSWSGNLVSNATWRDFWLNEGFTVYLEQRIMEALFGAARARMETLIGLQGLEEELAELPAADQVLHIDLAGRNPDDGMTAVPYDKGAAFLRRLEGEFGRERFDAFLARYFDDHAFRSITTGEFLAYLERELLTGALEESAPIDLDLWVRGPGLPADCPRPDSPAFEVVDAARAAWIGGRPAGELDTSGWVTMQWLHFLNNMPQDLAPERLRELDRAFELTAAGNSEILAAWLELAIRRGCRADVDGRLEQFLLAVGRRKFLKPLYQELAKTQGGKARALEIYAVARPRYHAVSTRTIDAILGWEKG